MSCTHRYFLHIDHKKLWLLNFNMLTANQIIFVPIFVYNVDLCTVVLFHLKLRSLFLLIHIFLGHIIFLIFKSGRFWCKQTIKLVVVSSLWLMTSHKKANSSWQAFFLGEHLCNGISVPSYDLYIC